MPFHYTPLQPEILGVELGVSGDVIEKQLTHQESNAVRRAYNHADYLPERAKMMQIWADWLENLQG
jgi:integrase